MPAINVKKTFGKSVREWRNHLGISQEQLAERADLHRTYVSDVERGARNLSLESITKLACALTVSVASLFPEVVPIGKAPIIPERNLVTVLLVEDNPDDAELTLLAFKRAHFTNQVHIARDGAAALDFLLRRGSYSARPAAEPPQLILLDLDLPKVNGLEVLRRIKADKKTRKIPVVILTASLDDRDMAECRRLGAKSYIVKPVDFQRLSQATPQLNLNWALFKPMEANTRNIRA